jgi:hypothetical protein
MVSCFVLFRSLVRLSLLSFGWKCVGSNFCFDFQATVANLLLAFGRQSLLAVLIPFNSQSVWLMGFLFCVGCSTTVGRYSD